MARFGAQRVPGTRVALARLVLLLVLPMLLAPAIRVSATVDRIEEDRLVLDVRPLPSLPIPLALAPALREGAAVTIEISRAEDGELLVVDSGMLELSGSRPFRWPASLMPRAQKGDRLRIILTRDPDREAEVRREIERLRRDALDP